MSPSLPVRVEGAAHAGKVGLVQHADTRVQQRPLPLLLRAVSPVREIELHVLPLYMYDVEEGEESLAWTSLVFDRSRGRGIRKGFGATPTQHTVVYLQPQVGADLLECLDAVLHEVQLYTYTCMYVCMAA